MYRGIFYNFLIYLNFVLLLTLLLLLFLHGIMLSHEPAERTVNHIYVDYLSKMLDWQPEKNQDNNKKTNNTAQCMSGYRLSYRN